MSTSAAHEDDALRRRRFGDPGRPLSEVGEAALLALLGATAAASAQDDLVLGPGDDAAVYRPRPGEDLVISQDALVEGEDFLTSWITPFALGRRAFAVAASDIAAMGAEVRFCLATLCASPGTLTEDVLAVQAGLTAAANEAHCSLAGGDVSGTRGPLMLDICVAGAVHPGTALRLGAARAGDAVVLTGHLGRAAAGLMVLRGDPALAATPAAMTGVWRAAQLEPVARLAEGAALAAAGVRCATDLSDGLLVSGAAMARASALAVEIWSDHLPVDDALLALPGGADLAVSGGEDFELLAAVPGALLDDLLASWPPHLAPLRLVGRVADGSGLRLLDAEGGRPMTPPAPRSRHFSAS